MSDNPTFAIKRKYILGLGRWLSGLSLYGRESRERTKFIETLAAEVKDNEEMRLEILNKYAEKDIDGKPVEQTDDKGSKHFVVPADKTADFTKEMNDYLEEEFMIEGDGNKNRLKVVKSIVLDTQEKIAPEVAPEYDAWCEAFEKVVV